MHSDLGGFAGDYFDNELYLRWLQYGVFNPIFRPHAQEDVASEVARKDIATMAKAKKSVELRYQLMPYNYTLSFDNNQKGTPLMRPLFFEDFLITPITKSGVTSTEIYFPKSSNWFDFYTNEKHLGGTTETVKVNEDYIPTFVRGGSFIPMIETIQNTSNYSLDNFNLHYYFDESVAHSNGMLYNDDGMTPNAFEKEQYEAVHFSSNTSAKSLIIKIATVSGRNFTSKNKNVSVFIHNISNKAKRIFVNGKEQVYKRFSEPLLVNVNAAIGPLSEIKIEY
jgi:alpha-glucosidase (family GH31 glycosyl hydrolase)